MISQISFHRMLYVGIGLITAVAVILAILVIPPSTLPHSYINSIWVKVIIHLLIIIALIWTIKVKKRGGQINKELLVAAGVIPIVLSLLILDGAFAYIDKPDLHTVAISMFICVGCDFVAGLLALIARYFPRPKLLSK